jgi:hypothetical protein
MHPVHDYSVAFHSSVGRNGIPSYLHATNPATRCCGRGLPTRSGSGETPEPAAPARHSQTWAMLIKRVHKVDPRTCGRRGGRMKVVAFIEPPRGAVIEKILRGDCPEFHGTGSYAQSTDVQPRKWDCPNTVRHDNCPAGIVAY